jgi:hypothetical protein
MNNKQRTMEDKGQTTKDKGQRTRMKDEGQWMKGRRRTKGAGRPLQGDTRLVRTLQPPVTPPRRL